MCELRGRTLAPEAVWGDGVADFFPAVFGIAAEVERVAGGKGVDEVGYLPEVLGAVIEADGEHGHVTPDELGCAGEGCGL